MNDLRPPYSARDRAIVRGCGCLLALLWIAFVAGTLFGYWVL